MLSREKYKEIIQAMIKDEQKSLIENKIEEAEKKEEKIQQELVWGGRETSMLNAADISIARTMLQRLENKYGEQFEAMGGTWDILGNGSRFQMATVLPQRTEAYVYTLVKTDTNEPWRLYYSDGRQIPSPVEMNSIPELKETLEAISQNFPNDSAENLFTHFTDYQDSMNRNNFRYMQLPEQQRVHFQKLHHLFNTHHHSKPTWSIVKLIETKIKKAKEAKPLDQDLIWQYEVMLSLLNNPRNKYAQSYYHPNSNPTVAVHDINLAKLMALLALAARDPNQVLRPQYQRRLNTMADPDARQKAKEQLIESTFDTSFLYSGLYDIAREHSDDNPRGRNDKVNHIPSCPGGSLGRSVFKFSPLNAVTALIPGNIQEIETAADNESAIQLEDKSHYQDIPHEIENYIFSRLQLESDETKIAVYRFFLAYMNGEVNPPSDKASAEEKEQYQLFLNDSKIYKNYLKNVSLTGNELIQYINDKILHLKPHELEKTENIKYLLVLTGKVLTEMSPTELLKKDYINQVYPNVEDRNAIDRLRKAGAKVLQANQLSHVLLHDEALLSIRREIKTLSLNFTASQLLINNEITRSLLACRNLRLPDQKDEWLKIKEKANLKIAFLKEQFEKEWKPRLNLFINELNQALDEITKTEGQLLEKIAQEVGYDPMLSQAEITRIKALATSTANKCLAIGKKVDASLENLAIFQTDLDILMSKTGNTKSAAVRAAAIADDIQNLNVDLGLPENLDWKKTETWVKTIAKSLPDNPREMRRIMRLMHTCQLSLDNDQMIVQLMNEFNSLAFTLPQKLEAFAQLYEYFPNIYDYNMKLYADYLLKIASLPDEKSENAEASLTQFREEYFDILAPALRNKIAKLVSETLAERLKDPNASEFTWENRNSTIRSISAIFPEIDLKYHGIKHVNEMLKEARALFENQYEEAYQAANNSLIMVQIKDKNASKSKTAEFTISDKTVFTNHFNQWIKAAASLLAIDRNTPDKVLEVKGEDDVKLKSIVQLAMITVCKQLNVSSLRKHEIEYIETLCKVYLTRSELQPNSALFAIDKNVTLFDRLNLLLTHLSALITALRPASILLQLGYIQLMTASQANKIAHDPAINRGLQDHGLIRPSASRPYELVFCEGTEKHDLQAMVNLKRYQTQRISPPFLNTDGIPLAATQISMSFNLFPVSKIDAITARVLPELTLTPPNLLQDFKTQIRDATFPSRKTRKLQTVTPPEMPMSSPDDPLHTDSKETKRAVMTKAKDIEQLVYQGAKIDSSEAIDRPTPPAHLARRRSGIFPVKKDEKLDDIKSELDNKKDHTP